MVAIATLMGDWRTTSRMRERERKFYLIQDFEPMFFPAGTLYALTEEVLQARPVWDFATTETCCASTKEDYSGNGLAFTPALDQTISMQRTVHSDIRCACYRLCLRAARALAQLAGNGFACAEEVKRGWATRYALVTAGSWPTGEGATPTSGTSVLLDYRATASSPAHDVGRPLTVSKHRPTAARRADVVRRCRSWRSTTRGGTDPAGWRELPAAKRTVDSLAPDRLERMCVDSSCRTSWQRRAGPHDIAARLTTTGMPRFFRHLRLISVTRRVVTERAHRRRPEEPLRRADGRAGDPRDRACASLSTCACEVTLATLSACTRDESGPDLRAGRRARLPGLVAAPTRSIQGDVLGRQLVAGRHRPAAHCRRVTTRSIWNSWSRPAARRGTAAAGRTRPAYDH